MEAVLSDRREVVISQPRGAGKTSCSAATRCGSWCCNPDATIIAAAAARDQAQHLFRAATRFAEQRAGAAQAAEVHAQGDPHAAGWPADRGVAPTQSGRWAMTRIS